MIPKYLSTIWAASAPALGNHLWQSTLFAIAAGLLTLILRKNRARVRYGIWLAASVKFLIPFSLLVGLGSHLARPRAAAPVGSGFYSAMEEIGQPFTQPAARSQAPRESRRPAQSAGLRYRLAHGLPAVLMAVWACGAMFVLCVWYARWRRISAVLREAGPLRQGREVEALRRLERLGGIRKRIELLTSPTSLEPGIFGIFRPVLVWPEGISERLEDGHLEAILAHEAWHVRRQDNLAAAVHMVVEALFWFHPLVWWLGARLVEERERACDEEVLRLGTERQVYAEGILKTCEFCVESPLACVSGVTGSDLKNRIVRVMTQRGADKLCFAKKVALVAAGTMAVAGPLVFGLLNAPQGVAQLAQGSAALFPPFEVASIRLNKSRSPLPGVHLFGGRFNATGPAIELIMWAYGRNSHPIGPDQILGGPGWIKSDLYDINAKVDDSLVEGDWKKLTFDQQWDQVMLMLQSLLIDRFKLRLRHEAKELPVYAVVLAKRGPKFAEDNTHPEIGATTIHAQGKEIELEAVSCDIGTFVSVLSIHPELRGRVVLDKTGLRGHYTFKFHWTMENPAALGGPTADSAAPPESLGPSLSTALREQLGLELKSEKGPVDVLAIDRIERPSEN
jgi:uncharacterized protein (TIGR03435 family)